MLSGVSPEGPVKEPGLMFEVKLFEVLQRNPLLLLPAPVEQPLHTALKYTDKHVSLKAALKHTAQTSEPEGGATLQQQFTCG